MTKSHSTAANSLGPSVDVLFDIGALINTAKAVAERDLDENIDIVRVLSVASEKVKVLAIRLDEIDFGIQKGGAS